MLLELHKVGPRGLASWFVDNWVASDGSALLVTPVDPTLLALPLLERATSARWMEESAVFSAHESGASLKISNGSGEDDDDDVPLTGVQTSPEASANLGLLRSCRGLRLDAVCDTNGTRETSRWMKMKTGRGNGEMHGNGDGTEFGEDG